MFRTRLLLAAGLLLAATTAHAQLPSPYTGAKVLNVNEHVFGAYVPISSNAVGALSQLRLSFLPSVDFGFQGGLIRLDRSAGSKTLVRVGADVRFAVAQATGARPLDMALGAGLGITAGDNYNLLTVGPAFVVSRSWRPGEPGGFTPYAGVGLALTTINAGPTDDNDFSVPLRVGAELGVTAAARLVGELSTRVGSDFGDKTDFTLGLNLPF